MKYYGVHGTLEEHAPGLFVIEASDITIANRKLASAMLRHYTIRRTLHEPQEIKGAWAEVLGDTLNAIRRREKEYYNDLGDEVFFVEV